MVLNPGSCHYMLKASYDLISTEITGSIMEKLLGVAIDKKLSFDVRTKFVCKKAR